MHFICSITHTLIKKNNKARIFFLESHNDPVFPFMNFNHPEATGHFQPLGCGFKATFSDDDHNEYFTFDLDGKNSPLVSGLLDYINKKLITKEEATVNHLLSHNSKNLTWGKIDNLENLFHRCRDQSVYLSRKYNGFFPFVSVMVMHESAYQLMIKHANFENALLKLDKLRLKDDFVKQQAFIENFYNKQKNEIEALRGKTHKAMKLENVVIDEDVFQECLERIKHFKDSDDPKMQEAYKKSFDTLRSEIGMEKEMMLARDRFVDQEYIDWYLSDVLKDIIQMNNKENDVLKKAGNSVNSQNYVLSKQIESLQIANQWKKPNWRCILESYLIEYFMQNSGLEFLSSRRQYQYRSIENKDFFQELTKLKVYK